MRLLSSVWASVWRVVWVCAEIMSVVSSAYVCTFEFCGFLIVLMMLFM